MIDFGNADDLGILVLCEEAIQRTGTSGRTDHADANAFAGRNPFERAMAAARGEQMSL